MIAANSFHMNCKMDSPLHRLKLPDISDKSKLRDYRAYLENRQSATFARDVLALARFFSKTLQRKLIFENFFARFSFFSPLFPLLNTV